VAKKINPSASHFKCELTLLGQDSSRHAGEHMATVLRDIANRIEKQYDTGEAFVKRHVSVEGIYQGSYSFQIGIRRVEREELEPLVREKLPLHGKVFLSYCYETSAWHVRCAHCARVFVAHCDLEGNVEFHHLGWTNRPTAEIPCGSTKP
jgi:hypothetical protein